MIAPQSSGTALFGTISASDFYRGAVCRNRGTRALDTPGTVALR